MTSRLLTIANDDAPGPMDDGGAPPDHVQPFLLESSHLRGRIVRLPHVIDAIVTAHNYPEPIARLLAEALCLTTLLAGMLKFDGVFTLQAKGKGIVKTLVCDVTNDGTLRGYAGFDADELAKLSSSSEAVGQENNFKSLTAGGYLAFTVDQATATDRYQGIVTLDGETLTDCVLNYFQQSEQIKTGFMTFVDQVDGKWTGGSIMLQHLPSEGGIHHITEAQTAQTALDDDSWLRAMMLMQTLQQKELLDAQIPLNTLLYRLFHEEGVRVFAPISVQKGCRCSVEKVSAVLDNLSAEDRSEYAENGVISVTCEFCNTTYTFPVETT